jgi:hypothetical protein
MILHTAPLLTYHNSVGSPSSQLILCAYDCTLDTKCSLTSSPAPTATFAIISFRAVFPNTSMWSPEFGPPRKLHASGECLICTTFREQRRNCMPYATHLMCDDLHARWVPAFASPTLCTHGTKRGQGHCSISFAYSNAVLNLESSISGIVAVFVTARAFGLDVSFVISLSIQFDRIIGKSGFGLHPSASDTHCA